MWMIAGLPGKLKALMDRLTVTRAANLDNLNATITSRAPAATALSNAVWTDTRAGHLDILGLGITRSIQEGYTYTASPSSGSGQDLRYIDVTISSVTVAKSFVFLKRGGAGTSEALTWANSSAVQVSARLINSTTLRIHSSINSAVHISANWVVVEFR